MMTLGAQMYTVRDYTKDLASFSETLKKLADIGYTDVQVSGTCAFEAEWLKDELKKNGLTCSITHTNPSKVMTETEQVIADHKTFGCEYIGLGSLPGSVDNYYDFRENVREAAKKISDAGLTLMLHNHHREFERTGGDNLNYLERFLADFSARELSFTLDTFWAQYGGADPIQWINKLSGRVPCVHLKDMKVVNGEQRMAPVGGGNMNFEGILQACEKAGTKHLLVEQDNCYGVDPFMCLKKSYEYLKSFGLK